MAASFEEDDFGVVQKKLAAILELLLGLYDALEKNIKVWRLLLLMKKKINIAVVVGGEEHGGCCCCCCCC